MVPKGLLVVTLLFAASVAQLEIGSAFLGRAFDVAKGSTHPMSIEELATNYQKSSIYRVLDPSDYVSVPFPAQQLSVTSYNISKVSDVAKRIGFNVSIGLTVSPKWGFQGSAIVNSVNNKFYSGYNYSYVSSAGYSVKFMRLEAGSINPNFLTAVDNLPDTYDSTTAPAFNQFIRTWGTHYINSVTLGGRSIFNISMTYTQYQALKSSFIDIYAGLQIQAIGSFSVGFTSDNRNFQALESFGLRQSKFTFGGNPILADSSYNDWVASLDANPMPIYFDLETYTFLIADPGKRDAVRQALTAYVANSLVADPDLVRANAIQEIQTYFVQPPPPITVKALPETSSPTRATSASIVASSASVPPGGLTYCVNASPSVVIRAGPCATAAKLGNVVRGGVVISRSCCETGKGCGSYPYRKVFSSDLNTEGYVLDLYLKQCTPLGSYTTNTTGIDLTGDCETPLPSGSSMLFPGIVCVLAFAASLFM